MKSYIMYLDIARQDLFCIGKWTEDLKIIIKIQLCKSRGMLNNLATVGRNVPRPTPRDLNNS